MRPTAVLVAALGMVACTKAKSDDPTPSQAATEPTAGSAKGQLNVAAIKKENPVPTALPPDFDTIWSTPLNTLQGKPAKLADFQGKELLVVNVASKCGNTPQYTQLEALQKQYEGKGFTVVGFPCNQFGGQEPGTAEQIEEFCSTTYGVTFPMMEKSDVNGAARNPIYKELTQIADGTSYTGDIRWNFEKFVISADGKTVTRFNPKVKPDDPAVIAAIEAGLPKS